MVLTLTLFSLVAVLPRASYASCGDGVVDQGEDCDNSLNNQTCQSLGFSGGQLFCSFTCAFDPGECQGTSNLLPDLIITDISLINNKVRVSYKNNSNINIPKAKRNQIFINIFKFAANDWSTVLNDRGVYDDKPADFMPGEESYVDFDYGDQAGQELNFKAIIDFRKSVAESDESNNSKYQLIVFPTICGDNQISGIEVCDGSNLNNQTCALQGYSGGTLKCASDCKSFDTAQCAPMQPLPDLKINAVSDPMPNNNTPGVMDIAVYYSWPRSGEFMISMQDLDSGKVERMYETAGGNVDFSLKPGTYHLRFTIDSENQIVESNENNNTFDKTVTIPGSNQTCGNGAINTGEDCDGTNLSESNCTSKGYTSGTLKCDSQCKFDFSGCITDKRIINFTGSIVAPNKQVYYGQFSDLFNLGIQSNSQTVDISSLTVSTFLDPDTDAGFDPMFHVGTKIDDTELWSGNARITKGNWISMDNVIVFKFSTPLHIAKGQTILLLIKGRPVNLKNSSNSGFIKMQISGSGYLASNKVLTFADGGDFQYAGISTDKLQIVSLAASCGDGLINAGEVCDGVNLNGQTCLSKGFVGGNLACASNCGSFNLNGCYSKSNQTNTNSQQTQPTAGKIEKILDENNQLILKLQRRVSELEQSVIELEKRLAVKIDNTLTKKLSGQMLLQTENNGEAWYVDPKTGNKFYIKDGQAAYDILRSFGQGISTTDLEKIALGTDFKVYLGMLDTDNDGLPDTLEQAIGIDPTKADTNGNGYSDQTDVQNGYRPDGSGKYAIDSKLIKRLGNGIFLQVSGDHANGQAWLVKNGYRYYLDPTNAYNAMRYLSLGISNTNLRKIQVGEYQGQ